MSKIKQTQKTHAAWTEHNFGTRPSHVDQSVINAMLDVIATTGNTARVVIKADQNIKHGISGLLALPASQMMAEHQFQRLALLPRDENMQPITAARSAAQAIIGAQEELGELAEAYRANNRAACTDAVADICIYLLHFCNVAGIDLEDAITNTAAQVHYRDWVRFPKNGRTE